MIRARLRTSVRARSSDAPTSVTSAVSKANTGGPPVSVGRAGGACGVDATAADAERGVTRLGAADERVAGRSATARL